MGAVDRELALLEQSNAALFAALAQTRAMPVSVLPPALGGEMSAKLLGTGGGRRDMVSNTLNTFLEFARQLGVETSLL